MRRRYWRLSLLATLPARKLQARKLQARKLQDSLVDRSSMEEPFSMRIAEITTALDSLSAQLAPRLVPLTRESEIQAVLREAFHQLPDHFAREDE